MTSDGDDGGGGGRENEKGNEYAATWILQR